MFPLLCSLAAVAGPFGRKTTAGDMPDLQVDRGYAMPRGWAEASVGADHRRSSSRRDRDGNVVDMASGSSFALSRYFLNFSQGFSKRVRLYAHAPIVRAALNRGDEPAVSTVALGDVRGGFFYEPWLAAPASAALQVDFKAPTGVEWPGAIVGGAGNTTSFLTGTGTTDVSAYAHGQWRSEGRVRLRALSGVEMRLPGVVGYVVEVDGTANGWLNAGDVWKTRVESMFQLGSMVALTTGGEVRRVGVYRVGTSGPSVWRADLYPIPHSRGTFADADLRLSVEPSDQLEGALWASYQLMGAYTGVFEHLGLDAFSPLPGLRLGGSVGVRW